MSCYQINIASLSFLDDIFTYKFKVFKAYVGLIVNETSKVITLTTIHITFMSELLYAHEKLSDCNFANIISKAFST